MIRRTASEVLRSLEARVARLEGGRRTASTRRVANKTIDVKVTPDLQHAIVSSMLRPGFVPHAEEVLAVSISEDRDLGANIHQIELIVSYDGDTDTFTSYLDADPEFFGAVFAPNGSIKAVDPRGLARFISTTRLDWE